MDLPPWAQRFFGWLCIIGGLNTLVTGKLARSASSIMVTGLQARIVAAMMIAMGIALFLNGRKSGK